MFFNISCEHMGWPGYKATYDIIIESHWWMYQNHITCSTSYKMDNIQVGIRVRPLLDRYVYSGIPSEQNPNRVDLLIEL